MTLKVPHDEESFHFRHCIIVILSWSEKDTYPWMKRRTVNFLAPRLALAFTLLSVIIHTIWALKSECGINFQRSGAMITFISAALYALTAWHEPKGGYLDGGPLNKIRPFEPMFLLPFLGLLGTIIWGYGDLLPFFGTKCS